jgi:hypothetical protein
MEAIFAGTIDLTYVGPNPALNAYIRSEGDEIRVLAGAAEGGAALVVPATGASRNPPTSRAGASARRSSATRRTWPRGSGSSSKVSRSRSPAATCR